MKLKRAGIAPRGATPAAGSGRSGRIAKPPRPARSASPARRTGGAHARRRGPRIGIPGPVRIPAAQRLAALLLAATLAAGLGVLVNGPWLRISSVAWAGSRYVASGDLASILDRLKGTSLLLLDGRAVAAELSAVPGVASAAVEPRFPDGVAVQLTERIPAIIWQTTAVRLVIDGEGTVFGEVALTAKIPAELARLPLVDDRRAASHDIIPGDRIPVADRSAAQQLGALEPRLLGSSARALRVAIDDRCGYLISPAKAGGWTAALGFHGIASSTSPDEGPSIEAQVAALRTLFSVHPERTVAWVDARNPGKVYWRPSGSGSDTC